MSEILHDAVVYVLFQGPDSSSQDDNRTKLSPDGKARRMENLARQNFDLVQQVHTLRELLSASGKSEASDSAASADKTKPEDQKTNVPTGTVTAAAAGAAAAAAVTPTTATAGTTTATGGPAAASGQSATSSMPPSEPSSSSTLRRPFQAGAFPSANDNVGKYKRQNVSPDNRAWLGRLNAKTARRRERSKN